MAIPAPLDTDLNKYFSLLTPIEKESVLTIIRSMVSARPPSPDFLTQYNLEIDRAVARVRAGEFTTQHDLEKEMKGWD